MEAPRLRLCLLLAGMTGLIFVLAAGLDQVDWQAGQPFESILPPAAEGDAGTLLAPTLIPGASLIWRVLVAAFIILTPVSVIGLLLSRWGRRRMAALLVTAAFVLLLLWAFGQMVPQAAPAPTAIALPATAEPTLAAPRAGTATAFDAPPEWAGWIVGLIIAMTAAALLSWIVDRLLRQRHRTSSRARLARPAQAALEQLEQGGDLRAVILNCYREMLQIVKAARGLERQPAATPHEFARELEQCGLPPEAVRQLTALFETERYSTRPATEAEERTAVLCLRTIVTACTEDRRGAP